MQVASGPPVCRGGGRVLRVALDFDMSHITLFVFSDIESDHMKRILERPSTRQSIRRTVEVTCSPADAGGGHRRRTALEGVRRSSDGARHPAGADRTLVGPEGAGRLHHSEATSPNERRAPSLAHRRRAHGAAGHGRRASSALQLRRRPQLQLHRQWRTVGDAHPSRQRRTHSAMRDLFTHRWQYRTSRLWETASPARRVIFCRRRRP